MQSPISLIKSVFASTGIAVKLCNICHHLGLNYMYASIQDYMYMYMYDLHVCTCES